MARIPKRSRSQMAALKKVAGSFKDWKPGTAVLTSVRSVPTCFPQFDVGTRVNGLPLQRVVLMHGPSNHGKTAFMHGLGASFLARDHFYAFIDAEFTTPEDWVRKLLRQLADHPGFVALRPDNYEHVRTAVNDLLEKVDAARDSGELHPDTGVLIGVDSIRKLIPKNLFDKLNDKGQKGKKGGIDGAGGRGGQIQAAFNSAWLNEMVPRLYHSNATLAIIARERANPDADQWEQDFVVSGGSALIYDASLGIRIQRDGWVYEGSKENRKTLGERHRLTIHKTKVGGKDDKNTKCFFHTSNGSAAPEGFDRPRDIVDMALQCDLLKKGGAGWIEDPETGETWRGENATVKAFHDEAMLPRLKELEKACREVFQPHEEDKDGGDEDE